MEKTAPIVDFNKAPLYNKEKIKSILPHREPLFNLMKYYFQKLEMII